MLCPAAAICQSGAEDFSNYSIRKVIRNYDDPEERNSGHARRPENG